MESAKLEEEQKFVSEQPYHVTISKATQHFNPLNPEISMPTVGFEPKISAGERPQAACLLGSWVRIPPGAWLFVCCECRVLSDRGLCDELISRPE